MAQAVSGETGEEPPSGSGATRRCLRGREDLLVADSPVPPCRNGGRDMIAPYVPPATRQVATTETAKML